MKRETAVISGAREGVATRGVVRRRTLVRKGGRAKKLERQRLGCPPGGFVVKGKGGRG